MQTLVINTHPTPGNKEHFSQKLLDMFLEKYDGRFDRKDLEILNLYAANVPRLDANMLSMWEAQASGREMTAKELEIEAAQKQLLQQFKRNHRIVIAAPTHNFMITSAMKDYMDNILIARETFRYTQTGSEGLMNDDYKMLLLVASGSIYTNNDRYTPLEMQHYYVKEMFTNIMAFNAFDIVRAQGTATLPAAQVLDSAKEQLDRAFVSFYQ
ncbi:MAG: NAD(P)H-dependent oxidoreductase [Actinomycetaceae bacterium]|nr:NAD(P)H-dependent oxidoreductase [Actinomycetaceae bacterium]